VIENLPEAINKIETDWRDAHVLIVGDVMLDRYVYGNVERISPEAPVPVVRVESQSERPGGAANVAMNIAGLGACATVIGLAGQDAQQQSLECMLADEGIEPVLIGVQGASTTTKLRVLSGHQQIMRLDSECVPAHCENSRGDLLRKAYELMDGASILVLSDYNKGVLTEPVCRFLINEARRLKIPVLVDPKARSFAKYSGAATICPNLKELSAVLGEPVNDLDGLLVAGQQLVTSLGLQFLTVTLGERGIAVLRKNSRMQAPAEARQVYDVSGAGDTVIAVLALALASGMQPEPAAQLANVAAGIVVSQPGTVAVHRDELLAALSRQGPPSMDQKVLQIEPLLSRLADWRCSGARIVFTNGCFDLLHVGHISLLEQARLFGDRLVVGLNSDASVAQLKGPLRPIVREQDRAKLLAALSAVDVVVLFGESTPMKLIQAIRPDVLVKGEDYRKKTVIGAAEVCAWRGRVEFVPMVESISTSTLIARANTMMTLDCREALPVMN
jgi:D-beta-D-heptose 7-phosphate kinase/D-beta-D-heptose 1-phosphate adenosyltransferase